MFFMADLDHMDKLVSLCKRRGYVFQSSEIYGGTGSVWDYGPLGVELKRNVKDLWWSTMVLQRDDVEGLDAAILMHPKTWEASEHVDVFTDPLVECTNCHRRFRADLPEVADGQCPVCGTRDAFSEPRQFNLMFKTFMGPVEDAAAVVYLRPETAQGIFVNFLNVQQSARQKIPFGIAQIGKAFRNEITPGNFIFRTREFEQAEMQFFVKPGDDEAWFERWKAERMDWHRSLGVRESKLRFHEHAPDEMAHYARKAFDVEYEFPFGWKEFEGIHNRTDFDLSRHQEFSGKRLEYIDPASNERYVPFVVETSMGVDRLMLVLLADAYREEEVEGEQRVVLGLHPKLAPLKVAVFPLVKKDGLPDVADRLHQELRSAAVPSFYDASGSIGRRYRRQDEAGTPWCVTVDGQTLEDESVTIRDRDSLEQVRVSLDRVQAWVRERLMIALLLVCAGLASASDALRAQDDAPDESPWSLAGEIGASLFFGVAQQTALSLRSSAEHTSEQLEFAFANGFEYGEAQNPDTRESFVNKRAWQSSLSMDYRPEARVSPFVFVTGEGSLERQIDHRWSGGAGARYRFVRSDDRRLDVSLAALVERTDPRAAPGLPDEVETTARWSARLRAGRTFAAERATFGLVTFYKPAFDDLDDYTVDLETSLAISLNSALALQLSLLNTYDSMAEARGAPSNNDGRLLISLIAATG
jgi:glycyl-tRNA synthetase